MLEFFNDTHYVAVKLENMLHDFWMNNITTSFVRNVDDAERLENFVNSLWKVINENYVNYNVLKKAHEIAQEFRVYQKTK